MASLIHQLITRQAVAHGNAEALLHKDAALNYRQLAGALEATAQGYLAAGISPGERIAVYLPKQPETVIAMFGASAAGACFVPINPLLKPQQVAFILKHCNVRILVTSAQRLQQLHPILTDCTDLHTVAIVDGPASEQSSTTPQSIVDYATVDFAALAKTTTGFHPHHRIDTDMAAILYTSGSTGNPKGVVLSHRNMLAGAESVAEYLGNRKEDRLLAVLPLSFDAGLSQLTTAFSVAASVVLMDYLLPRDVIRAVERYGITGLAAVPPLWNQLQGLEWPAAAVKSLRYITNTGGAMPVPTTRALRAALPNTQIFLMYGLTEAFRSTYLDPAEVDTRPESIGKAIPNAHIMVVNEHGEECRAGEPGELVHRGALVAMGYWNDPEKTAARFKPAPGQIAELPITELAVWSGDQVMRDEEGYLYFISRKDEMIKTSGYRVSPTEVEDVVYQSGLVAEVAALGLPHPGLGQAILLVATAKGQPGQNLSLESAILKHCGQELPNFMVPRAVVEREILPRNQNGKIDRRSLAAEYQQLFQDSSL